MPHPTLRLAPPPGVLAALPPSSLRPSSPGGSRAPHFLRELWRTTGDTDRDTALRVSARNSEENGRPKFFPSDAGIALPFAPCLPLAASLRPPRLPPPTKPAVDDVAADVEDAGFVDTPDFGATRVFRKFPRLLKLRLTWKQHVMKSVKTRSRPVGEVGPRGGGGGVKGYRGLGMMLMIPLITQVEAGYVTYAHIVSIGCFCPSWARWPSPADDNLTSTPPHQTGRFLECHVKNVRYDLWG